MAYFFMLRSVGLFQKLMPVVGLLVLHLTSLNALDFAKFLEISPDQGLPGSTVRCLLQDESGVIWMGVEGSGLCKYNGHDFLLYSFDPEDEASLDNNNIEVIFEDSQNRLWVGTMSGLNLMDRRREKFTHFQYDPTDKNSLIGNIVFDMEEDENEHLWIGTENGLCVLEKGSEAFREIQYVDESGEMRSLPRVWDLYSDRFGFIWASTKDGLFKLEPGGLTCLKIDIDIGQSAVPAPIEFYAATEDRNGRIWVGSDTCLLVIDEQKDESIVLDLTNEFQDPGESDVSCLLTDSRGYIWVGTFSDGIRVIDPFTLKIESRFYDSRVTSGLTSDSIRDLIEDENGIVWLGVKHRGIALFDPRREVFRHIQGSKLFEHGLKDHRVFSLGHFENDLWVGTLTAGLFKYNTSTGEFEEFSHDFNDETSLMDNRIESIYSESKSKVLVATGDGVSILNPQTGICKNYPFPVSRSIVRKDEGEYWVGTSIGVSILDERTGSFHKFPVIDGIDLSTDSRIDIRRLYLDEGGILWIASNIKGLWAFDTKSENLKKIELPVQGELTPPVIRTARAFLEDSKGRFWVCTRLNGLFLMDRDSLEWKHYSIQEGMPTKSIFGILEDDFGNLWLSSNSGIINFNPDTEDITVYDVAYGLQGMVFENSSFAKTSNGTLFFGGSNGLNSFKPDQVRRSFYDSDILFSRIVVDGEDVICVDSKTPETIVLPYNRNSINFTFSLADYSFPGKNEYRYKMSDIDRGWQESGARNFASYPSLPPGEYTFEIQARNPNEKSYRGDSAITIRVTPPFWDTIAFRILVIFLGIVLIVLLFVGVIRNERAKKRNLERLVEDRTAELQSAYGKLQEQTEVLEQKSDEIERQNEELTQHKYYLEELVVARTKELEAAKDKAEESERIKSAFLANMSHEIRTPLNAIVGFSQMIAVETEGNVDLEDYVHRISENTELLVQLLDDIIDFSILESGKLNLKMNLVGASDLHEDLSLEFASIVQSRLDGKVEFKKQCHLHPNAHEGLMVCDRLRIKQILNNFVTNACKFTSEGFISFEVGSSDDGRFIEFSVRDTGIGIAPEHHDKIFERFHKVTDDSHVFYQGAGLGLSISKSLADLMNCKIRVESAADEGAVFTLSIPVGKEAAHREESLESVRVVEQIMAADLKWSDKTVLVAEDIVNNYDIVSSFLDKTQVNLVHAKNGAEAVEMFNQMDKRPDALLFDIKMPKLSGDEALQEIRQNAPDVPAIALTAHAMSDEREKYLHAGFNGFLVKPLAQKELLSALAPYLN